MSRSASQHPFTCWVAIDLGIGPLLQYHWNCMLSKHYQLVLHLVWITRSHYPILLSIGWPPTMPDLSEVSSSEHFPPKFVQPQHCVEPSIEWLNFHVLEFRVSHFNRSAANVGLPSPHKYTPNLLINGSGQYSSGQSFCAQGLPSSGRSNALLSVFSSASSNSNVIL